MRVYIAVHLSGVGFRIDSANRAEANARTNYDIYTAVFQFEVQESVVTTLDSHFTMV